VPQIVPNKERAPGLPRPWGIFARLLANVTEHLGGRIYNSHGPWLSAVAT